MHELPLIAAQAVPWISVAEMREVDRLMTDELGVALPLMMENAGRSLAVAARGLLDGDVEGRRITVLAGAGGNGGGGMAAARHLHVAGALVQVLLATAPTALRPVARLQFDILRRAGVPVEFVDDATLRQCDLVLDALLGYSQSGPPRANVMQLIELAHGSKVLALDVPSGLELETEKLHEPHVRADATLTLALPKAGLRVGVTNGVVGELLLADISVPPLVYERIGRAHTSPFSVSPIVRIGR